MRDRYQIEKDTPQVKADCKERFVDDMPKVIPVAHCEKHGDYEYRYIPFSNNYMLSSSCTECVKDRDAIIELEVKHEEAEHRAMLKERLITASGVSKRNLVKTFDTYIAQTPEQVKAKALWQEFANSVSNGVTARNLITCGSVGVGKTHLASSAINQITGSNKKCRLVKIIDLIRQFKSTWSKDNDDTEEEFLHFYTTIPALIIDEVGVQFGSDTEKMVIFDIIDGRYNNMLPTALISNLALQDVQELIGERAIDRLREDGGVVVAMKWESHRGMK